ncbi:unnamed protein product [Paramecium sonneborni]|uniref:Elongation factor 1-gamma n=1 Tax=Paramecium sonneborni TaxID=65129 RepID=A0A8S1QIU2_9CILI|nr:unnamed protein product [Paramecium sonneborni]
MSIKLHSPSGQGRTHKILVAAKLANFQLEFVDTQLNEKNYKVFQDKFPFGKVPVLETQEGNLFESNAILRYIARHSEGLYGKTPYQQGLVDQWLDVTVNELESDVVAATIQVQGQIQGIPTLYKKSLTQINHTLNIVNNQLEKSKYISGESLTVADIALAQVVTIVFTLLLGEVERNQYQHLLKWLNEINQIPEWRAEFGRPRFAKNAFTLSEVTEEKKEKKEKQKEQPKQKEQQEQPKQQKEQPKQQKEQPKQQKEQPKQQKEQPKQQKEQPKQQPKQEEEDDAPKKKEQNPLDLLPPSTFNIDDYKRIFFAEKDINKNINTLFSTIDLNGWSLWFVRYNKAENEGKQMLLTNNLMKGFINQRLDQNFRKYAFAIHGVYGDEPNLQTRGAWIWRGTEVPKEWKEHIAYDYHEFVKVDINNEAQKQLFTDYWVKQEEDVSEVEGLKARSLLYFR